MQRYGSSGNNTALFLLAAIFIFLPYGIFSTQKHSSQRKEKAIRISQTTITNLKIEVRAEWSKSPTVLTTTQAAKLVGCSNALINSWMKKEDGLRFVRAQNGVFTTKEWLIDYFAHYTKDKNQNIELQCNNQIPIGIIAK